MTSELSKALDGLEELHAKAAVPSAHPSFTAGKHVETRERAIVWREDDPGNDFAAFIGPNCKADEASYRALHNNFPLLLALAREAVAAKERTHHHPEQPCICVWCENLRAARSHSDSLIQKGGSQ